jgi:RNA polymerase sigma factor (sigma-70 family)
MEDGAGAEKQQPPTMSPRISIRLLAAQSDRRLSALARDGHERAFEALVHRYRRPLLRYCRSLRLSDARAEDVLQQALLRAWMALSDGADVRDLRPWLYRIVHNTAVNAMRGAAELPHGELSDAVQAGVAHPGESELDRKMAVRDALGHVAALPQMQRQAIFLTAVDGQSHEEVAGTLGITPGALRGLLYRARTTLRSAAAMLTPQPLLELAARSGDAAAPSAERALELTGGAGAVGIAGLLLKGGAAVITAGALATGATVVASHEHRPRHSAKASLPGAAESPGAGSNSVGALAGTGTASTAGSSMALPAAEAKRHSGRRSHSRVDGDRRHRTARHDRDDLQSGALSLPSTSDGEESSPAGPSHHGDLVDRDDSAESQQVAALRGGTHGDHSEGDRRARATAGALTELRSGTATSAPPQRQRPPSRAHPVSGAGEAAAQITTAPPRSPQTPSPQSAQATATSPPAAVQAQAMISVSRTAQATTKQKRRLNSRT